MCTAISFLSQDHYFGRNLDLEYHYEEAVVITPRNYPFSFRAMPEAPSHYALIGIAYISDHSPLYYEATNEHGLSMAGLNFPGNAVYHPLDPDKYNPAPFELIPWILGQCKTVGEAEVLLRNSSILAEPFNDQLPLTPLHWMVSDSRRTIVVEPMADGLKIYENPIHVLTNNPPFPYHLDNICNYLNLTAKEPVNRFHAGLQLEPYSRGMGAMGLPGDLSSSSRFVRAAFTLHNAKPEESPIDAVTQFFHILGSVEQQEGCVQTQHGFEKTIYSSCCNTTKGIYYYKTYANSRITAVDLWRENLNEAKLVAYPLIFSQDIATENQPSPPAV